MHVGYDMYYIGKRVCSSLLQLNCAHIGLEPANLISSLVSLVSMQVREQGGCSQCNPPMAPPLHSM